MITAALLSSATLIPMEPSSGNCNTGFLAALMALAARMSSMHFSDVAQRLPVLFVTPSCPDQYASTQFLTKAAVIRHYHFFPNMADTPRPGRQGSHSDDKKGPGPLCLPTLGN